MLDMRTKRRLLVGVSLLLAVTAIIIAVLAFSHSFAVGRPENAQCFNSLLTAQWPKWIGCAMAAHENLAGGLIATGGAIFAAWLAFSAVQEQLAAERQRMEQDHLDAKETARMLIVQPIHAAAATLMVINRALSETDPRKRKDIVNLVELGVSHTGEALEQSVIYDITKTLSINDRLLYLTIVTTLGTFLNTSRRPSPVLDETTRLDRQRHTLKKVGFYLKAFDAELAAVWDRDSGQAERAQTTARP